MEATSGRTLQFSSPWLGWEKIEGRLNVFLRVHHRCRKDYRLKAIHMAELPRRSESTQLERGSLSVIHACQDSLALALELGDFRTSCDAKWLMKRKGEEVASYLNGRCIFLVGMMGSGKTTVGKVLSEALPYSFVDSDQHVEQALGGSPVAQIFKQFGESFFRDYESETLRNLSSKPRHVVATGGGAVLRSTNWKYMKKGVTVYLDVPVDALARRIAAVGTESRPLLQFNSGDAYTKTFMGLFTLFKKRGEAYAQADATVSLKHIAAKLHLEDFSDITPTEIALEVLVQIQNFLRHNNGQRC